MSGGPPATQAAARLLAEQMRAVGGAEVGDVVRLRSAGPAMTVAFVEAGPPELVKTVWFRRGEYRDGFFETAVLVRAPPAAPEVAGPEVAGPEVAGLAPVPVPAIEVSPPPQAAAVTADPVSAQPRARARPPALRAETAPGRRATARTGASRASVGFGLVGGIAVALAVAAAFYLDRPHKRAGAVAPVATVPPASATATPGVAAVPGSVGRAAAVQSAPASPPAPLTSPPVSSPPISSSAASSSPVSSSPAPPPTASSPPASPAPVSSPSSPSSPAPSALPQAAGALPASPLPGTAPAADPLARQRRDFDAFLARSGGTARLDSGQRQALFEQYLAWSAGGRATPPATDLAGSHLVVEYTAGSPAALSQASQIVVGLGAGPGVEMRAATRLPRRPTVRYRAAADRAAAESLVKALPGPGDWHVVQDTAHGPPQGTLTILVP